MKFLGKTKLENLQDELFSNIEKVVNIAIAKTKRNENDTVKKILKNLEEIFWKFWDLKKHNPDKFDALLWDKDFLRNYVTPVEPKTGQTSTNPKKSRNADEIRQEAQIVLLIDGKNQLKGLTYFLSSFKKIWDCAFGNNNDEINRFTTYHIIRMLSELSKDASNTLFVKQFLALLNQMSLDATKQYGKTTTDNSIFASTFHWYGDIVFNNTTANSYNLSYMELFDEYFFSSVKNVIIEDKFDIFKELVVFLHEGIPNPIYHPEDIEEILCTSFGEKISDNEDIVGRIDVLSRKGNTINTLEDTIAYSAKFNELKNLILPQLTVEEKKEFTDKEAMITTRIQLLFKFKNLIKLVYEICAFCLYKKRFAYVEYFWKYKQPSDADAWWAGPEFFPRTLENTINLYLSKISQQGFSLPWEDHHGKEIYHKHYFILLLLRILQDTNLMADKKCPDIENLNLSEMTAHQLDTIVNLQDVLLTIANDIKKDGNLLTSLGLNINSKEDLFDIKLKYFFEIMIQKAKASINKKVEQQEISSIKIKEYKDKLLKTFYKNAEIRNFFKACNLYTDLTSTPCQGELPRFGLNKIEDKAYFGEEQVVRHVNFGDSDGKNLAQSENLDLYFKLAQNCTSIEETEFASIIEGFKNTSDIAILATSTSSYRFLSKFSNFIANKIQNDPVQSDFIRWNFLHNKVYVPIFLCHLNLNKILILNKSRMGFLVQHSPLNNDESITDLEDMFYVKIQNFSANPNLVNNFIANPPPWLKEVGIEEKQKKYLYKRVLIHVFERFVFQKHSDFQGYRLDIKN